MVKITNGKDVFTVTRGAFDGIYSRQGYKIVKEKGAKNTENADVKKEEKSDDELFLESIIETPISKWDKDEIKRFAALKGIDISGTKNAGEAKELIKQFMEENN